MTDLMPFLAASPRKLEIIDLPPIAVRSNDGKEHAAPRSDREILDELLGKFHKETWEGKRTLKPKHIVLDGLTAMQTVLSSRSEARRLTQLLIATLSYPRGDFDLIVMTAEAHAGFTA